MERDLMQALQRKHIQEAALRFDRDFEANLPGEKSMSIPPMAFGRRMRIEMPIYHSLSKPRKIMKNWEPFHSFHDSTGREIKNVNSWLMDLKQNENKIKLAEGKENVLLKSVKVLLPRDFAGELQQIEDTIVSLLHLDHVPYASGVLKRTGNSCMFYLFYCERKYWITPHTIQKKAKANIYHAPGHRGAVSKNTKGAHLALKKGTVISSYKSNWDAKKTIPSRTVKQERYVRSKLYSKIGAYFSEIGCMDGVGVQLGRYNLDQISTKHGVHAALTMNKTFIEMEQKMNRMLMKNGASPADFTEETTEIIAPDGQRIVLSECKSFLMADEETGEIVNVSEQNESVQKVFAIAEQIRTAQYRGKIRIVIGNFVNRFLVTTRCSTSNLKKKIAVIQKWFSTLAYQLLGRDTAPIHCVPGAA